MDYQKAIKSIHEYIGNYPSEGPSKYFNSFFTNTTFYDILNNDLKNIRFKLCKKTEELGYRNPTVMYEHYEDVGIDFCSTYLPLIVDLESKRIGWFKRKVISFVYWIIGSPVDVSTEEEFKKACTAYHAFLLILIWSRNGNI